MGPEQTEALATEGASAAAKYNAPYFSVSAALRIGMNELLAAMVSRYRQHQKQLGEPPSDPISAREAGRMVAKRTKCSIQ